MVFLKPSADWFALFVGRTISIYGDGRHPVLEAGDREQVVPKANGQPTNDTVQNHGGIGIDGFFFVLQSFIGKKHL